MVMAPRERWLNVVSWLTPPALVVIAVSLDRWLGALREEASASFNFAPAAWGGLGANLAVAALLLLLAWLVAFRAGRTRGPAALSLLLGVLMAVYPWLLVGSGERAHRIFMWPPLTALRAFLLESGSGSRSTLAGTFLTLAGLLGLILSARQSEGSPGASVG
jgi:hypothetical protein